jgi:hypothetical protein
VTEISFEEYEMMMEIAERDGLCPNCFHTLACCDGKCKHDESMEHVCAKN